MHYTSMPPGGKKPCERFKQLYNFPDDISSLKISQSCVNDGDDVNIRAVADVVIDDELEVGDVDEGQIL